MNQTRRNWQFALASFFVVVLLGGDCPTTMNPMDNTNENTNTNDNINSNGDRFRLTVNWEGAGFGSTLFGAQIWAFIADTQTLRADGNYSEQFGVAHRFVRTSNNPNRVFEIDVDAGKTVSIVAFDDAGKILNLFQGAVPPSSDDTNQIEFVSMSGDFDNMPETGVGTVLMNADKDVTVRFAPMPTIVISNSGLGLYNVKLEVFGWLHDPELNGVPPTADCMDDECDTQCLGSQTWDGDVLHLAFKSGTRLTITSIDCIAAQYDWNGWDVSDNCTDRTCILTFGLDGNSNANWEEK